MTQKQRTRLIEISGDISMVFNNPTDKEKNDTELQELLKTKGQLALDKIKTMLDNDDGVSAYGLIGLYQHGIKSLLKSI